MEYRRRGMGHSKRKSERAKKRGTKKRGTVPFFSETGLFRNPVCLHIWARSLVRDNNILFNGLNSKIEIEF